MTILSRGSKHDDVPQGVAVKAVDYDDIESLKSALAGQDAVVSAIATVAVATQQYKLADAAFGTLPDAKRRLLMRLLSETY